MNEMGPKYLLVWRYKEVEIKRAQAGVKDTKRSKGNWVQAKTWTSTKGISWYIQPQRVKIDMGRHKAVADLHSQSNFKYVLPFCPKFLHFHAIVGKIWLNNNLVSPFRIGTLWEILDLPLQMVKACHLYDTMSCWLFCTLSQFGPYSLLLM